MKPGYDPYPAELTALLAAITATIAIATYELLKALIHALAP